MHPHMPFARQWCSVSGLYLGRLLPDVTIPTWGWPSQRCGIRRLIFHYLSLGFRIGRLQYHHRWAYRRPAILWYSGGELRKNCGAMMNTLTGREESYCRNVDLCLTSKYLEGVQSKAYGVRACTC